MNKIEEAYNVIIADLVEKGYDTKEDLKNFEDTPKRCAKVHEEFFWSKAKINKKLERAISRDFPIEGDVGIVAEDCTTISMCPHHLISVNYQIYLGYMPKDNSKVIGTSKLIRIARYLAKRPVLQEQYLKDITAVLFADGNDTDFPAFDSLGSFCFMNARHGCMTNRGVKAKSSVRGASVRGCFLEDKSLKMEAYELVRLFPSDNFSF